MGDASRFRSGEDERGAGCQSRAGAGPNARMSPVPKRQGIDSDVQVFDCEEFVNRCGGDVGIATRIAAKFRDRSGRDLDDLQSAIGQWSVDSIIETAHRLKGVAASMAAHRLAERYRELEAQARDGNLSGASDMLRELKSETAMFNEALASALGTFATR